MLKKIIKFMPGVAIPMIINFVLTILYAQFLEPAQYGILNVYLNSIQIIYAITTSVFQNSSLRYYSIKESYSGKSVFYSTYIISNLLTSLIIIPITCIINIFFEFNWWIIVLSVGCNSLYQFTCNMSRLENRSAQYNILRCFTSFISIILVIYLFNIFVPFTYIWPIITIYGSYGLIAIFEIIRNWKQLSIKNFSIHLLSESLTYGLPLIGVTVLGYIIASCDQYFLLYFLGEESVGNYSLGHRLVDALVINMLTMILLVMTPELNTYHDNYGEKDSSIILKNMINAATWIILPLSFAVIIYAEYIIKFVFPAYTSAAEIMRLVVFASIFHGISMFTCKGLELVKQTKYVLYSLLVAAIINCTYNAIFIPIYGVNASAHSSLVSYIFYNLLLIFFTKRFYLLRYDLRYLLKSLLATGLTVLVAFLMKTFIPINSLLILIIQVFICLVFYFFLSSTLKLLKAFK